MGRETVAEELADGVLLLTLDRPRTKNAFNDRQYDDFRDALLDARESDAVRAVVITGRGDAFSSGQDLSEMARPRPPGAAAGGFMPFLEALATFDKPLLAAVNGVAVGIGTTLLLHCDIVYVGASARLRMPFVSIGFIPEAGSSYLLQQIVGSQKAAELVLSSDWISSSDAAEWGLAARCCRDDELLPAIMERARQLAAQPPRAMRGAKKLLLDARADALNTARERERIAGEKYGGAPENLEAIRAFLEKRPPDFSAIEEP